MGWRLLKQAKTDFMIIMAKQVSSRIQIPGGKKNCSGKLALKLSTNLRILNYVA
jgi:hypothetical protein